MRTHIKYIVFLLFSIEYVPTFFGIVVVISKIGKRTSEEKKKAIAAWPNALVILKVTCSRPPICRKNLVGATE